MKRKRRLLEQSLPGLSVHVQPFTRQLSELSPEEFCEDVLVRTLNSRVVLVGRNFRFGKNRAGNLETLTDLGRKLGFEARAASLVGDEGGPFSSTRVREALAQGDVQLAARILSRPHLIVGRVVRGDGRGRALGFPTANLVDIEEVLPAEGVYAVAVYDAQSDGRFLDAGVAHCGSRPTLDRPASFEVHLLNQRLDLYDRTLGVCFFARVRGVQKFANVAQLTAQIESDANVASAHLRSLPSLESTDWW
jgi:riboflavin kinase/FMN adenylyltransferase